MTAKTPNIPSTTPPDETELTLRITEVRDSSGTLVSHNTQTFDTRFTVSGEADPSKPILIRDGFTTLATANSDGAGAWKSNLFEVTEFKSYSLTAMGDYGNKPVSTPPFVFVVVTETPIIDIVTDAEGTIADGAPTYYTSVTLRGKALPNEKVQAFNGNTPLEEASVGRGGDYTLRLENLAVDTTYAVTVKALYGEGNQSESRSFTVRADIPLSLDAIEDSNSDPVNDGDIIYDNTLTIRGKARPNKDIQLLNNGDSQGFAPVNADDNGDWENRVNVRPGPYSLRAKKLYAGGDETDPPRTFTVLPDIDLSLDEIEDSNGEVLEDSFTFDDTLTVRGQARPRERVQLFNNGTAVSGATDTAKDDGTYVITLSVAIGPYKITAKELDTGKESAPPRTFTVLPDVALSLDDVRDSKGPVPEGETTTDQELTIRGQARPRERVQLFNNGVPIASATDTAKDDGTWEITFTFPLAAYSLTVKELGTGNESTPPRTFTVRAVALVTLETVTDNNGKLVDKDGSTFEKNLNVEGEGEEGLDVEIFDGTDPLGTAQVRDGRYKKAIGPLGAKTYALVAKARYPDGGQSEPYRFTVEQSEAPTDTRVYVGETLIPDNGPTSSRWVTVWGKAEPLTAVKVKINGVIQPELRPTNSDGVWLSVVSRLNIGTTYVFSAVRSDNHDAESNTWTITITATPPGSTKD